MPEYSGTREQFVSMSHAAFSKIETFSVSVVREYVRLTLHQRWFGLCIRNRRCVADYEPSPRLCGGHRARPGCIVSNVADTSLRLVRR